VSPSGYDYTLNGRCVACLLEAGENADRLERLFSKLGAQPFSRGDYQERDSSGRTLEVLLQERWLITYWADHATKQVHVIDLEDVG
jgi:hypothetical protein